MYLFLFGRDYKLSILEVFSYFKLNNISFSYIKSTDTYAIFDFKQKVDFSKIIDDLGGTTRIYKVFYSSNKISSDFLNFFDKDYSKKFNYGISYKFVSDDDLDFVKQSFKEQFKLEKVKGVLKKAKKFKDKKENTIINPNNYFSYSLDKGFEIFFTKVDNKYYLGYAVVCYSPKDIIKKDTLRPEQEKLYSTSFRLTKIMINILGLKKGKRILDPFCGFGNFLIEGLSKGYNVLGIDKEREKVISSKKNLAWAVSYFKYTNDFTVLHGDSSKLNFSADGVVFEPYMGPFISKLPNFLRAKSIVDSLNKLYSDLFRNLYSNLKPKTRIVCILPELKTYDDQLLKVSDSVFLNNGFSYLDTSKITNQVSIENPIFYAAANDSKINRYIYILERK